MTKREVMGRPESNISIPLESSGQGWKEGTSQPVTASSSPSPGSPGLRDVAPQPLSPQNIPLNAILILILGNRGKLIIRKNLYAL